MDVPDTTPDTTSPLRQRPQFLFLTGYISPTRGRQGWTPGLDPEYPLRDLSVSTLGRAPRATCRSGEFPGVTGETDRRTGQDRTDSPPSTASDRDGLGPRGLEEVSPTSRTRPSEETPLRPDTSLPRRLLRLPKTFPRIRLHVHGASDERRRRLACGRTCSVALPQGLSRHLRSGPTRDWPPLLPTSPRPRARLKPP